jgi:hypothetical protein
MDWLMILLAYILMALAVTAVLALAFRFFNPESEIEDSFIAAFGLVWPIVLTIILGWLIHHPLRMLARLCRKTEGN